MKSGENLASASSITVSNEGRFRSSESILREVRSRSPGLRHLYNTHLKKNPGLGGKVTIRFAIAPGGQVIDAAMVSSTTGSREFEEEVLNRVRTWNFGAIKAVGNDIVTVPFNFSE
jgi:TonB family protein